MKYSVSGNIKMGSEKRVFAKTVEAKSENDAKEKVFSLFGSMNGLQRSMVNIEKVEQAKEVKE